MSVPLQVVRDVAAPRLGACRPQRHSHPQSRTRASTSSQRLRAGAQLGLREPALSSARARRAGADRHVLVLTVAAPCADGGALATIAARARRALRERLHVADEPLQYADFAEWQNQLARRATTTKREAGRRFWSEVGYRPAHDIVPFVRRPRANRDGDDRRAARRSRPRGDLGSSFGVRITPDAIVQAAWHVVACRLSGDDDLVVRLLRPAGIHEELETAVGAFARPLPVRLRSGDGADASRDRRGAARTGAQEVAERWQDYAPGRRRGHLHDRLRRGRARSRRSQATASRFSCRGPRAARVIPARARVGRHVVPSAIRLRPRSTASSAERMARHVERVLATASAARIRADRRARAARRRGRARLTVDVNDDRRASSAPTLIHELVGGGRCADPDRDAVVDETRLAHVRRARRAREPARAPAAAARVSAPAPSSGSAPTARSR